MLARLRERLTALGPYIWRAAIILYVLIQGSWHFQVYQARSHPPEIDDLYSYIWQSARLAVCLQSCPALDDLKPILQTPSSNKVMQNTRTDTISRLITTYAPLQEGALLLMQRLTGWAWSDTYWLFIAGGLILQAVGIGLILRAVWGDWAAAFGLISIAFSLYKGQGLHFIVPSNVTLAIALIVWACLVTYGRAAQRGLLIGVTLLALSHPIGRIYALMSVALYGLSGHWRLTRREIATVVAAFAIIGGYWLFARVSTAPPIDANMIYINPDFPTYGDLLRYQMEDAALLLWRAFNTVTAFPTALDALVLLLALGLVRPARLTAWGLFALCAAFLLSTAFVGLAAYPGEGATRAVVSVQIVLVTGGAAAVLVWSMGQMALWLSRPRYGMALARFLGTVFVATISLASWTFNITDGINGLNVAYGGQKTIQNYALERADLAVFDTVSEATVLYMDEIALYFGLSNGLHRFNALYPPVMDAPPDWSQVDYVVAVQTGPTGAGDTRHTIFAYPDLDELFILVEGLNSDVRVYRRLTAAD